MDKLLEFESRLKSLRFVSNPLKFLEDFMAVLGYPKSTIDKFKISSGGNITPDNVYVLSQRLNAIFTLSYDLIATLDQSISVSGKSSLDKYLLIFSPRLLLIYSYSQKEYIISRDSDLYTQLETLLHIAGHAIPKADKFNKDIEISELLAELFNDMVLTNSASVSDAKNYLLQLIYLAYADLLHGSNGSIAKFFDTLSIMSNSEIKENSNLLFDFIGGRIYSIKIPGFIGELPRINSELFAKTYNIQLGKKHLQLIRTLFKYNWTDVKSESIGSLIYKFLESENETAGLHFTSSSNVLKLINPLFIDEYYKRLISVEGNLPELESLAKEVSEIKLFDPTSSPGSFLSVAYKELWQLMYNIRKMIVSCGGTPNKGATINLSNFYALVSGDFGVKLSRIVLAITDCQQKWPKVDVSDFESAYSLSIIKNANPLREDWNIFCPNRGFTFIIGSPVFKGAKKLSQFEIKDMRYSCGELDQISKLDYCSAWLFKSAKYISKTKSRGALALTNSITQGEQVSAIWPEIFKLGLRIFFAYTSFKWKNSLNQKTAVTVVIIGICDTLSKVQGMIFDGGKSFPSTIIGPYLTKDTTTIIESRRKPINNWLPSMPKGNMPYDNGHLLFNRHQYEKLISSYPSAKKYLKKAVGSEEYINSIPRYCIWIEDSDLEEALEIREIRSRVDAVRRFRQSNSDPNVQKMSLRSHQFRETRSTTTQSLVIPSVSSENRVYIPMGFVGPSTVVTNLACVIYDCPPWIMGLLVSKMHLIWIKTVCGRLESRLRYSPTLGYNTFPVPILTELQKVALDSAVYKILKVREKYSELSLGDMYQDDKMPGDLSVVHTELDFIVDSIYTNIIFESESERITHLLNLYDQIKLLKP